MNHFALSPFVLALACAFAGCETHSVRVIDAAGRPVSNVRVIERSGTSIQTYYTDKNGEVHTKKGRVLEVSKPGYTPRTIAR